MEYIALRQKEGAFRKCDPAVAVMFAVGPSCNTPWASHLFAAKNVASGRER